MPTRTTVTAAKTTGQVAALVGLTEPQLQAVLRRHEELRPLLVRGRRRWRGSDVARLQAALRERS